MQLNIVIPMAGDGKRFKSAGYKEDKPFIDVLGKTMIERVVENIAIFSDCKVILIVKKEQLENYSYVFNNLKYNYNLEIVTTDKTTEGAACTVLLTRKYINNDYPLLIANSDQLLDCDIKDFIFKSFTFNSSIMVFTERDKNPKWSYVKIENSSITRVAEKDPISYYATVGLYYFNKGRYFVDAAIDMIAQNDRVNGEFYVCPIFNYLINENFTVYPYFIEKEEMHCLGTPEDLERYLQK